MEEYGSGFVGLFLFKRETLKGNSTKTCENHFGGVHTILRGKSAKMAHPNSCTFRAYFSGRFKTPLAVQSAQDPNPAPPTPPAHPLFLWLPRLTDHHCYANRQRMFPQDITQKGDIIQKLPNRTFVSSRPPFSVRLTVSLLSTPKPGCPQIPC